jgi:hypothetical protein
MDLLEWLKSAEQFLPQEDVAEVRRRARAHVLRQRQEALAKAALLDEQARALDSPVGVSADLAPGRPDHEAPDVIAGITGPSLSQPLFPAQTEGDKKWAQTTPIPTLVVDWVKRHPGTNNEAVIEFVHAVKGGDLHSVRGNVYSTLGRLSQAGGPLRKAGERMAAQFFPASGGA